MTASDLDLLSKEADNFLNSFKDNTEEEIDYQTDLEKAYEETEKLESIKDFKTSVNEVFKNFPTAIQESPLESLKNLTFYGRQRDKMAMVYYYLLKIIEYFSLNGDVLKTNLSTDKDVILLTLKLEEKLLISFNDSLVEVIFLLLEDKQGKLDNFIERKNINFSPASTLLLMKSKETDTKKQKSLIKMLILADYIKAVKQDELIELIQVFDNIINETTDESFIIKIEQIFSDNIIKQPSDINKFLFKILEVEKTREELGTNLYNYARNIILQKTGE